MFRFRFDSARVLPRPQRDTPKHSGAGDVVDMLAPTVVRGNWCASRVLLLRLSLLGSVAAHTPPEAGTAHEDDTRPMGVSMDAAAQVS